MGTYKYPKLQIQHVKLAEKIIKICTSWLKQNGIHSFLLSYEKLDFLLQLSLQLSSVVQKGRNVVGCTISYLLRLDCESADCKIFRII